MAAGEPPQEALAGESREVSVHVTDVTFEFEFEFECNVCNVNNVCIPTRGVLSLCFHDQYMVCSVLIEPKMSSGGHRAAEKSSSSL